jgi:type IV secretion system protein TrbL
MRILILIALVVVGFIDSGQVAFAADQTETLIQQGTGLGGKFDQDFITIALGFIHIARIVVTIMTCVALMMVMWGIENGKRTLWNWILGVGLAVNFGAFIYEGGFMDTVNQAQQQAGQFTQYVPDLKGDNDSQINIFAGFMNNYRKGIIEPGAAVILPVCMRILIILTLIQTAWDLSFKLISGDKIKYLLSVSIKVGIIMFFQINWINGMGLMTDLSDAFQQLGFMMGGQTGLTDLDPDSIANNAIKIFAAFWDKANFSSFGLLIINVLSLFVMVILLFLTSIEMFMARIEFYTMAILVMPLLSFMITSKFSFLSDKSIGAMFNLAIKCCVIAFLTTIIVPFLNTFAVKVAATSNPWEQVGIVLQSVLAAMLLYMLTKRVTDLVSGLLNGQPSLGGSNMISTAGGAIGAAASVASGVGAARGASALAKAAGGKGGMSLSTLAELGRGGFNRNPITQRYRSGISGMSNLKEQSGSRMLNYMENGKTARGREISGESSGFGGGMDAEKARLERNCESVRKYSSGPNNPLNPKNKR